MTNNDSQRFNNFKILNMLNFFSTIINHKGRFQTVLSNLRKLIIFFLYYIFTEKRNIFFIANGKKILCYIIISDTSFGKKLVEVLLKKKMIIYFLVKKIHSLVCYFNIDPYALKVVLW